MRFGLCQVLSALMQRRDLTKEQCRAAVSVCLHAACFLLYSEAFAIAILHAEQCPVQSIVDGEINVAQAAAFMVLLHSKVMLHVQHDLLVALVQVNLHI